MSNCSIIKTPLRSSNGRFLPEAEARATILARYEREKDAKRLAMERRRDRQAKGAALASAPSYVDETTGALRQRPFLRLASR